MGHKRCKPRSLVSLWKARHFGKTLASQVEFKLSPALVSSRL
jgi:hypothetical protein